MNKKTTITDITFIRIILILSFVLVGLYYEICSAIISCLLFVFLIWKNRNTKLNLYINDSLIAVTAIFLFYLISVLWAVDKGLAPWGAVRVLPVPLFCLTLMQITAEERVVLVKDIPWIGAAMTVLSFALSLIPTMHDSLIVSERLGGFFEYPNTFASFLLIGLLILILLPDEKIGKYLRIACSIIIAWGIYQAGSRTVFVMAVPLIIISLILKKSKEGILISAAAIAAGRIIYSLSALITSSSGADRVGEITSNASTLLGRFLYWKDAFPVILKHPLGLGYLGYYFSQGSFQTGVYSVRWVHNDALQILLDIGWIPAILCIIAIVGAMISKNIKAWQKVILIAALFHCMMDFDLEFVSMYFIILLCLDIDAKRNHPIKQKNLALALLSIVLIIPSFWIGASSSISTKGDSKTVVSIYKWDTFSKIKLLTEAENANQMEELADSIISTNKSVSIAWSAKSMVALSRGDVSKMIEYKKKAIELSKYNIDEYEAYFEQLAACVQLYYQAGDSKSAEYCIKEIVGIKDMLAEVEASTDELAYRIADTPDFEMSNEYYEYINSYQGVIK